jgi:hypothetical protein
VIFVTSASQGSDRIQAGARSAVVMIGEPLRLRAGPSAIISAIA